MTDRELLEWAADAAGIKFHRGCEYDNYGGLRTLAGWWNPLSCDAAALRLAVKLGLSVVHRHDFTSDEPKAVAAAKWPGDYDNTETYYGGDPYAATRRAIVRAAAEVGKTQ
jgi:hypothetical protein